MLSERDKIICVVLFHLDEVHKQTKLIFGVRNEDGV